MMRSIVFAAVVCGLVAMLAASTSSTALAENGTAAAQGAHPKSNYYHGGASSRRRGGYSYKYEDAINTYGDSRGQFGSADSLRDQQFGRQTEGGPFDHGFFYDSGTAPHGGDSPYMN